MKKYVSFLVVAILGGVFALMLQIYVFPAISGGGNQAIQASGSSNSVPTSFTSLLSNIPTNLPDFTVVAELSVHSVVHIKAEFERPSNIYNEFFGPGEMFREFFGPRQRPQTPERRIQGSGSGVIISPDGYVITNNHVVQDAITIEVNTNDNRVFEARVIGLDPTTDLALLKIEGENFPFATFGDSDKVKVGQWVLAVGNPFNLTSTVTAGIVSATGRNINILGGQTAIESFIQTDAAVNRGNSGGALVNTNGELIGINAAIASTTGTYAGYSFAIPSNIAAKVVADLKQHGEVQRGFLGIGINDVTPALVRQNNLKVNRGVYVARVDENSAASTAGLKQGDVITAIDGRIVNTNADLLETIGRRRPGDQVVITYNRDGRNMEGKAVLRNVHGDTSIVKPGEIDVVEALGATLENVSANELRRLRINNGVKVNTLARGKLASAGIKEGFIITQVDREPVRSARELVAMLNSRSGGVLIEGIYPNGTRAFYGVGL